MKESDLYNIWAQQRINHDLYTTTGQAVRVLYPGNLNSDKGADFKDASLKIGNKVYHGDVEIHIKKRDWLQHKHQFDPEYNKVILHLIWVDDKSQVKNNKMDTIPTLLLSEYYLPDTEITKKIAYDCQFFSGLDKIQLNYILSVCGKERIQDKAQKYKLLSYLQPEETSLYCIIAQTLGNPNNKLGMKLIADLVDKKSINKLSALKLDEYYQEILSKAGLAEKNINSRIWNKFRIRPASQPEKRVKDYINFRYNHKNSDLTQRIWDSFTTAGTWQDFMSRIEMIFNNKGEKIFGQMMIRLICYNALFPFLYYKVREINSFANITKLNRFITNFPKIATNRVINSFMTKISDYQLKNLKQTETNYQGLYFLMNNFCRSHDCARCRIKKESYLQVVNKQ